MKKLFKYRVFFLELILPENHEYVPTSNLSGGITFYDTNDEELEITDQMWHKSYHDIEAVSAAAAELDMLKIFAKSGSFNFKLLNVETVSNR